MTFRPRYNVMVRSYGGPNNRYFLFEEEEVSPEELPSMLEKLSRIMARMDPTPPEYLFHGKDLWSPDAEIVITLVDGCEIQS